MSDNAYRPTPVENPPRYWCTVCKLAYPGAGSCPRHDEEPLLDMGDQEVLSMLEEQDDRVYWQRTGLYTGIAAGVSLFATVAVVALFDTLDVDGPHPVVLAVCVGMGVAFALLKLLPPPRSSPALTEAEKVEFSQARSSERGDCMSRLQTH